MFRFVVEPALWTLALVPLAAAFFWWVQRRRRRAMERFGDLPLVRRLSQSASPGRRRVKLALLLAALALLAAALARPQFGSRVETVRREGRDVVVALDVSRSMLAEDVPPSRLEQAKLAIRRLIDRMDGDRIALVAFAGDAFIQCPLTGDYAAATMFLNAMGPDLLPVQGTDLGKALAVSLSAFRGQERHSPIVIVISDGEDHQGDIDGPLRQAAEGGVVIHTVGIGSADGVPIPTFDEEGRRRGFQRDAAGNVVTTRLEEGTLRHIADATGGRNIAARGRSAVGQLADAIGSLEAQEISARRVTVFEEQYQIFLGAALVLLLLDAVLSDRRQVHQAWAGRFQ